MSTVMVTQLWCDARRQRADRMQIELGEAVGFAGLVAEWASERLREALLGS